MQDDKSSVTEPRQLDEAELDAVSGGDFNYRLFGGNFSLTGDQLTVKFGNTTFTKTLNPTQAARLQTAADYVAAGDFSNLRSDIAFLKDVIRIRIF